jgi:hypothetical protein
VVRLAQENQHCELIVAADFFTVEIWTRVDCSAASCCSKDPQKLGREQRIPIMDKVALPAFEGPAVTIGSNTHRFTTLDPEEIPGCYLWYVVLPNVNGHFCDLTD